MPFTFEDQLHKTPLHAKEKTADRSPQVPPAILDALAPAARATALQFESLLGSAPADLSRISDEIRSHPRLEKMVMSLLASLMLCPEDSAGSVEEATIVLGTDRLRVLVCIWLLTQEKGNAAGIIAKQEIAPASADANSKSADHEIIWTPEMLYLASLVHWLGLDSPPSALARAGGPCTDSQIQRGQLEGIADLLIRDFMSLIPFLNPALLGSVRKLTLDNGAKVQANEPA
jgi:hypothetical protein